MITIAGPFVNVSIAIILFFAIPVTDYVSYNLGVDFIAAVQPGDVLTAVASEVNLAGRTGVYDVEVRNQHGARVALFRGRSYRLTGKTVVDLPTSAPSAIA